MNRRTLKPVLAGLLTLLLVVLSALGGLRAAVGDAEIQVSTSSTAIPITQQPFYPQLQSISERWKDAPLSRVVGESPRETLLNFYAVMARVHQLMERTANKANHDPGLDWSPESRTRINDAEELFKLAVQSLDANGLPESMRQDMGEEAALKLKEVLDYVFTHSSTPIQIPDAAELKAYNEKRSRKTESWTLPHTSISLVAQSRDFNSENGFIFSANTVENIHRMYNQIKSLAVVQQPFATAGLYQDFAHTPGFLIPPKWYLKLPTKARTVLELSFYDQTLLQIAATVGTILLYFCVLTLLARRLIRTYRHRQIDDPCSNTRRAWLQDSIAWKRVILTLPLLPLTSISESFIDDYVNFSGTPLMASTYLFYVFYFVSAGFFFFFFFEALGRSLSEQLARWRGGNAELQLKRISNIVMPVCRALGGFVAVAMVYRLLVAIGLPATTVLAFSAVPGLAIGLGASKLLGNLFGGLSIQTDRPVRVGEFCRIGENLGFVTKIGLRSLELQTLESRVTIPNAIVDDETIVNFSNRLLADNALATQSLLVRLAVTHCFSPDQIADLLYFSRLAVANIEGLEQPLVTLEQEEIESCTLLCHSLVSIQTWNGYLEVRERLLLRLEQVIEQVRLSDRQIGVSYDTTSEQLARLPGLIRNVVEQDHLLKLQSCRLMTIGDFSYNFSFRFHSHHNSFSAFKDAIGRLNHDLLACLGAEGIEVPYPTAVEIQKDS